MFANKVAVLNMARSLAVHAAARQGAIARNVAHADTPGYAARDLPPFADLWRGADLPLRATRPAHLHGSQRVDVRPVVQNDHVSPNGNAVSLEHEMLRAAQARQQHDMALAIHRSLSGNIRSILGRR